MKFSAAILLFAQVAYADGHADEVDQWWVTSNKANATSTEEDHASASLADHMSELDMHLMEHHQRLHMALEMVEMFCKEDSNTTDDDGDNPNDDTDSDGRTDGDGDEQTRGNVGDDTASAADAAAAAAAAAASGEMHHDMDHMGEHMGEH